MIKIERFVNQLMTSNCFIVVDKKTKKCIVIDPGSEMSEREIGFIQSQELVLDYIIISHEHTDHNWGVNALMQEFPSVKLIASEVCSQKVKKSNRMYFLYYYDDPDYKYDLNTPNILISEDLTSFEWGEHQIKFVFSPGHSYGSMCINIDDLLFTGDTIMPYKPFFNGRDSNEDDWESSVEKLKRMLPSKTMVYPGHGERLTLGEWFEQYR